MNINIDFNVLFIVFLVLKLCKVIDWSWWWVTCPLWGWFLFVVIVLMIKECKDD